MSAHEQFGEDLALYALESLHGDDRVALELHLQGCADCRSELAALRGDMALLSLAAGSAKPPARSRQRLLAAVASEPRNARSTAAKFSWWRFAPLLGAAAACVMIVLLLRQNSQLTQSLASLQSSYLQQQVALEDARDVATTLTAPQAQQVTLVVAKSAPQPQGKAFYLRDRARLVFLANNLPPLAPEKIYELWLIPKTGAPVAAGLFRPDAHGSATVVNPPLTAGLEAKNFVVTLEPESGSHAAPRGPAVIAGE